MKKILLLLSIIMLNMNIFAEDLLISKEKLEVEEKKEKILNEFFTAIKFSNNTLAVSYISGDEERNISIYPNEAYSPGFAPIVKKGVEKVDINAENKIGETALMVAIEYNNIYILEELLKKDVNVNVRHNVLGKYPLHTAIFFENFEAVKLLVEKYPEMVNFQSDVDGWHPLEDAALKGNYEIAKFLIEKGANPLHKDFNGGNAIDLAANFGKGDIVKLLRDKIKELRNNK
ncbi:ankyrin repeat domain-containing protein [Streptobacillus moniliformis]|uniref:Ankyrin n=1 Tax=Streptobacillus moniliformis (strain ATCC 14647 / DSM 12112 / NCTC 10651 / 9901) TaxID=519441 RepID=D1AYD8_STRM9|nr:ankyrin repeat domain-containing protein [Streptobacillus moniliformis]ACZ01314.1 Ankyrin [Streptobacillus moniliformis DSM 12112]AVL43664.1 ankyrin repeat domain-containing protein [Streptobacillus moniliformis]SQA13528.1 Ribulose-5-phosphate 4-epimerase and related epimerases and aldolases [Streptobacillus moniliformis]